MHASLSYWAGRTVCITGGAGFLGWHLVQALRRLRARVRVLAIKPGPAHPIHRCGDVARFWGDVRDEAVVRPALAGCSVVFHMASVVAVWGDVLDRVWSVNVDGTRQVLSCLAPDARLVFTSSITTLGAWNRPRPISEDLAWNGAGASVPYIHAKRAAEAIVMEAVAQGRHAVIANPGSLVGPEDHERSIMGRLCERFWRGRIPLAPPGGMNFVDVRDVALGHLLAAERGRSGQRYLLGGEDHTFVGFLRKLALAAGYRPRFIPSCPWPAFAALAWLAECRARFTRKEPYPSLAHAETNRYFWFGTSAKAQRELGYEARPLHDALKDAFAWHHQRRPFQVRGFARWWLRPGKKDQHSAVGNVIDLGRHSVVGYTPELGHRDVTVYDAPTAEAAENRAR